MKTKYMVMAMACAMSMSYAYNFGDRIGVLKTDKNYKCPNGEVVIDLDVEDSSNRTKVASGDKNPPGISLGGHAVFTYCIFDAQNLVDVPFDYVVLRLDGVCPAGGMWFARHHDTEDHKNANDYKGDIWPSVVNSNATIEYCLMPKKEGSKNKYPIKKAQHGEKYGVFANPDLNKVSSYIKHSEIYIDDEDNQEKKVVRETCYEYMDPEIRQLRKKCKKEYEKSNNDEWIFRGANDSEKNRVYAIMSGKENTTYHVIKWTGGNSTLSKSAEADVIDAPVAAMPVSATIRGLDRSNITVELQTAGNAKISVMNVNGAVVANIAQENLMPGVHQVKWNSGIVPNGVYIVKVVHNGMVNSKRVILK